MVISVAEQIGGFVKQTALCLAITLLAASAGLLAQTPFVSDSLLTPGASAAPSAATPQPVAPARGNGSPAPFSRLALSGGVSLMGINMQAAVNANRYLNIRGIGNYFTYTVNNATINDQNGSNGISVSGKLNLASAGVSLDFYPWPNHGFRLSPGAVVYNQNRISATGIAPAGQSFTLNGQRYYSESANPINATAALGFNTRQQAFSMTTGWGNLISRRGGHFSVPFEIGAVFTGAPTLNMTLAGSACLTQLDANSNPPGPTCVNAGTDATVQSNLAAQIAKYKSDLNPFQVYPIISIGVGYNFKLR